jgi:hypothetical protein
MSGLRDAAERLRRSEPLPILSLERLFVTERAAAQLAGRRYDTGERSAETRELRLGLAAILHAPQPAALLDEALAVDRRSVDRAIVAAYLAALPTDHVDLPALRDAAETAATRHDWRWRELGERLRLWSPERDASGVWRLPERARAELATNVQSVAS